MRFSVKYQSMQKINIHISYATEKKGHLRPIHIRPLQVSVLADLESENMALATTNHLIV